jgi:hypothetical protein
MGPTGRPETSVTNYQSTLRNIPEEREPQLQLNLMLSVAVLIRNYLIIQNMATTTLHKYGHSVQTPKAGYLTRRVTAFHRMNKIVRR